MLCKSVKNQFIPSKFEGRGFDRQRGFDHSNAPKNYL